MVGPEMSQYHYTKETQDVKSGDTCVAEPIPVEIAHRKNGPPNLDRV